MRRAHARALDALEQDLQRRNLAPATCTLVRRTACMFLRVVGPRRLNAIDQRDVRAYLARRSEDLCPAALRGEASRLRTFFRALLAAKLVAQDPTAGLPVSRVRRAERSVLTRDEIERLLAAALVPDYRHRGVAGALRDRAAVELLYGLGLRASELQAARLVDLDPAAGTLLVRRAKRGEHRVLPLPARALEHLRRYLAEGRQALVRGKADDGRLIVSALGRALGPHGVGRLVDRVARKAGIRTAPHQLRRGLATHLVRGGVSLAAVQDVLGHQRLSTTQVYLGVAEEDLRAAVELLELRGPS